MSIYSHSFKAFSLTATALALTACASMAPLAPNNSTGTTTPTSNTTANTNTTAAASTQSANKVQAWVANGAIAVKSANQSGSASYRWRQSSLSHYDVLIFGPLGAGTMHLTGNASNAILINSKGLTTTASSPEALLQQQAGWSMPVSNMYYWARGLPAPGGAQTTYNSAHQLQRLVQGGWTIQYLGYSRVNGVMLPTKIYMNNGNNSVRLSINQWSV